MLYRTHLAISVFLIVLFLPVVNNPLVFSIMVLIATFIPDIDTAFSKVGKNIPAKVVQVFTEHRGMLHSITICFVLSIAISIFIPVLAFGFFLGYSSHLLADSFTKMGITPFWPYSRKASGLINTGGVFEKGIFVALVFVDILLVLFYLVL